MILALCGFMGCGKTTIGKNLSNYVYSDYIDLDEYLVEKFAMPIKEYFARNGETAFREEEAAALMEITQKYSNPSCKKNLVLSLGGGTPTLKKSEEIIKGNMLCVYLKTDNRILYKRLNRNNSKRPVLKGTQGDNLMNTIDELVGKRESVYRNVSKVEIDCSALNIIEITDRLSQLM